jgi:hypothetical protein
MRTIRIRIARAAVAQRQRSVFYTKLVAERGQGGNRHASNAPAPRHRLDANHSQQPPDERSFRGLDSVLGLAYYVPMP